MMWLVACVLCALVDEGAFYDDPDDDFDEAYDEDDSFTPSMTVSRDYARKRRSDVTTSLSRLGTTTKRSEYEDTETDAIAPKPFLPLTMLPVFPDLPKRPDKANTDNLDFPTRSVKPNTNKLYLKTPTNSGKSNDVFKLYPESSKRTAQLNTGITAINLPTRSLKPKSGSGFESRKSGKSTDDITSYLDVPTKYPYPTARTEITINPDASKTKRIDDLTIYPDLPTRSTNPTDVSTLIYPTRSPSPNTDTTTDTISTMSTVTTDVYTNASSSSLLYLSPVGFPLTPFAYTTECENCENNYNDSLRQNKFFEMFRHTYPESTTPTTPTPPKPIPVNVPLLLKLIDNLTMDYDWNLTRRFNESLQKYRIPTCAGWTTLTTEEPTTNNFENASLISKCFVCGLKTPGIPYDSRCADAFSGDFIPLVPVDAKARGYISRYRKYCRYLDVNGVLESPFEPHSVFGRFTGGCSVRWVDLTGVNGVLESPFEPHSVFGRFTGGCSVRWVDLTGVYTQRACRNRRRAVMGNHFGSKRMAKLEMSLKDVDDGCIISPVATLLPLSRGISLYARFHACVCSGSWCNRASQKPTWTTNFTILLMLIILKILS